MLKKKTGKTHISEWARRISRGREARRSDPGKYGKGEEYFAFLKVLFCVWRVFF
jgi:hypothetical protein